jgi:predicted metal-dependent hydrolase
VNNLDPTQLPLLAGSEAQDLLIPGELRIRESKRARTISIQVFSHGGVEVVAPPRTSPTEIELFVRTHKAWIAKSQAQLLGKLADTGPLLPESIHLRAFDEVIAVEYQQMSKPRWREQAGTLFLQCVKQDAFECYPILHRWLVERARKNLPQRLNQLASLVGLSPNRIQIRRQKTRWGSCSSRGTISLNAAILLLEPELADYVIIHELCHLKHLNHSKRYWKFVERFVPDYREKDKTIDQFWDTAPLWVR